jgi:predicted TIM-barrel fold metal-dependent hydrolase
MRVTQLTVDELEFIGELGERFPDLDKHEVMNAYCEYSTRYVEFGSVDGRTIMRAYKDGAEKAIEYASVIWGMVVKAPKSDA